MAECPRILRYARVGDLYEFLGEYSIEVYHAVPGRLRLEIGWRDIGGRDKEPMVGFPVAHAEVYLEALRAAGYELQELPTLAAREDTGDHSVS